MAKVFIGGGLNSTPESEDYIFAKDLGKELAERGFTVVSTAYLGVAEATFIGASLGNDNSKRIAIGCDEVNLPRNKSYTDLIIADNYFDMKMKFCTNADAFVFLPGYFDTLSIIFIVLQLKQLKLMGKKPVICVGELLEEMFNNLSFYNDEVLAFYEKGIFVNTVDGVIDNLKNFF